MKKRLLIRLRMRSEIEIERDDLIIDDLQFRIVYTINLTMLKDEQILNKRKIRLKT